MNRDEEIAHVKRQLVRAGRIEAAFEGVDCDEGASVRELVEACNAVCDVVVMIQTPAANNAVVHLGSVLAKFKLIDEAEGDDGSSY